MMTETVVQVQDSSPHSNNAAKPNEQNGQANQQQSPLGWVKINVDYFKTLPGMLKIAEAVSCTNKFIIFHFKLVGYYLLIKRTYLLFIDNIKFRTRS